MSRVRHPVFARVFDRLTRVSERVVGPHRDALVEGLSGRVVEVGAGNGANLHRYPSTVTEVVAVEPEPYLRGKATAAAARAPVRVDVVDGTAENLPLEDGACDAAVASLVLCTVPDPSVALAEIRRVLRPGGELRFYEHVLARDDGLARRQRRLAPLWRRVAGGCRLDRDTVAEIERAGFAIERVDRFDLPKSGPVAPHVLGVARR